MELVLQHWPFVAAMAVLATLGQAFKKGVLTKERAARSRMMWMLRATLPAHPIIAGAALGLVPDIPVSVDAPSAAGRCLYFAFAGMASVWVYDALVRWLELRGIAAPKSVSMPPPAPTPQRLLADVDAAVDAWHDSEQEEFELADWLRMSPDEYALYVLHPTRWLREYGHRPRWWWGESER